MQRVIKTSVIALLLLVGYSNVYAAEEFGIEVNQNQILVVEVGNVTQGGFLSLIDTDGVILFQEKNLAKDYRKTLSLERLPEGEYILQLENEEKISEKVITKKGSDLHISEKTKMLFKPEYQVEQNRIKISITNPEKLKTTVSVYDKHGTRLASLPHSKQLVLKKTFDFTEVPSGEYTIAISVGSKNYYKTIKH